MILQLHIHFDRSSYSIVQFMDVLKKEVCSQFHVHARVQGPRILGKYSDDKANFLPDQHRGVLVHVRVQTSGVFR